MYCLAFPVKQCSFSTDINWKQQCARQLFGKKQMDKHFEEHKQWIQHVFSSAARVKFQGISLKG